MKLLKRLSYLRKTGQKRKWTCLLLFVITVMVIAFFVMVKLASLGAAQIFNQVMAHQTMLRGTVKVESLTANTKGQVFFTNLEWDDPSGNPLVIVPSGSFHVRVTDIITRRIRSTTIDELTLNDPYCAIAFDEKGNMDFVNVERDDSDDKKKDDTGKDGLEKVGDKIKNFNWDGRKIKAKIIVNQGHLEWYNQNRHYVLKGVNTKIDLNTLKTLTVDFHTGKFGGNMIGEGVDCSGYIDFSPSVPQTYLNIVFRGVDPSSMGFGDEIHDTLTLSAAIKGPVTHLVGDGHLDMDKLTIPALEFGHVHGDIHYENSLLTFTNVKAEVYGGRLSAHGDYNLNTREYNIYAHGEDMDSRIPSKDPKFYCLVTMDAEMHGDGNPKHVIASGMFSSGPGFYALIPFDQISGTFNNRYRHVDFYDVSIVTRFGTFHTDSFHIIDGKLHIGDITLTTNDGETTFLKDGFSPLHTVKEIQSDIKSIKKQVNDLKP